jgi:hypothetical protein
MTTKDTPNLSSIHVHMLMGAGYHVFENATSVDGSVPGSVVIADPVLCMSGRKQWAEVRRVTLRTPREVFKFITERE